MDETQETDEAPLLAARVSALPEAVQLSLEHGLSEQTLFVFVRALKAFEITMSLKLSGDDLANAFSLWWGMAGSLLPVGADFDEWRFSFQNAWAHTRSPLGANQLEEAIRRADTKPTPPEAERYPSPKLKRLTAVCYHLQSLSRPGPFFLSARDAARIIGIKQPHGALAVLGGLVSDGVLTLIAKGTPGGRRATRYQFNAPEFRRADKPRVNVDLSSVVPSGGLGANVQRPRTMPPITHFQLVEKKKALEDLLKSLQGKDLRDLSTDQRNARKEWRAKLKEVTQKLATFGE